MKEVCLTLSVYVVADDDSDVDAISAIVRAACESVDRVTGAYEEERQTTDSA